jgi:8-oxo-dGTP pyrophosphatase MutT (NUDIX family)
VIGFARRLASLVPQYVRIAWWGAVAPRWPARDPLRVFQAVVLSDHGVLLSVRRDLRGWELPGGNPMPSESDEAALRREVAEETGLEVEIVRHVGDYTRTGFAPHLARVFECRVVSGEARPSWETPVVQWFAPDAVPETLFPWYRQPLADALARYDEPVTRHEHQGLRAILAGGWIDLRMRLSNHRAGLPPGENSGSG